MAENNSSAPLKTAEGAYPALPAPDTHCHDEDTGRDVWSYSAEQMRAYAAQAVAAQAAPAAVAVRDEREAFEQAFIAEKLRVMGLDEDGPAVKAIRMCHLVRYGNGDYPSLEAYFAWFAWQARAALAATPAHPATEDSSAGDLAEAQAEPVAFTLDDSELEDLAHAANQEALSFGVSLDPFLRLAKTVRAKCTAPQAQPADALDANMFWNNDDSEEQYSSIEEFLEDEINQGNLNVGDVRTLQRGFRLPNIAVRVTSIDANESEAEYEVIDAAMAAAQEGGNAAKEA
ncbi:hypothetical protein [Comamonas koreensis]|uniref:Uncharacterized protein n=1 Tax=Comamonas koreensis TaxID=160825 RepID=A0AAW4XS19_9BURK|nr:hypothetical protein [Comamonas koreensis]MCD2164330.1 hypothetical protein [Comamonas koreensis]